MNIERMQRIIFVADVGSITDAATQLHISQPSLSQMILSEEKELGAPIFDRRQQPLSLTPAGEIYLRTANTILQQIHHLKSELNSVWGGYSGKLAVGISNRRCLQVMPFILPDFYKKFPSVRLELIDNSPYELEKQLRQGKIDLYLGGTAVNAPQINTLRLCHDRILLLVSKDSRFYQEHRQLEYKGGPNFNAVPIIDAADESFFVLRSQTRFRSTCDKIFFDSGIQPNILLELDSSNMAYSLISNLPCLALVSAILPADLSMRALNREGTAYFAFSPAHTELDFFMNYRKDAYMTQPLQALIDITKKYFHHNL